jgi:chromosome segregation ATPase
MAFSFCEEMLTKRIGSKHVEKLRATAAELENLINELENDSDYDESDQTTKKLSLCKFQLSMIEAEVELETADKETSPAYIEGLARKKDLASKNIELLNAQVAHDEARIAKLREEIEHLEENPGGLPPG